MGFISGVGKVLKGIGKTGINAIEGIGEGSLFGAEKIEKLIVPDNIKQLGNHIVCESSITRVYVHGNLELNPNAWSYGHPHLQILSKEYLDQLSCS